MNGSNSQYNVKEKEYLLEQYKLYVQMADQVSQRRMDTNKYFVAVHTFIITFITVFGNNSYIPLIAVSLMGIVLSGSWFFLLTSYRQLNSGKFKVIHGLEEHLPYAPYKEEWDMLLQNKKKKNYWRLSYMEITLPLIFGILYLVFLIYICHCLKNGIDISIKPL